MDPELHENTILKVVTMCDVFSNDVLALNTSSTSTKYDVSSVVTPNTGSIEHDVESSKVTQDTGSIGVIQDAVSIDAIQDAVSSVVAPNSVFIEHDTAFIDVTQDAVTEHDGISIASDVATIGSDAESIIVENQLLIDITIQGRQFIRDPEFTETSMILCEETIRNLCFSETPVFIFEGTIREIALPETSVFIFEETILCKRWFRNVWQ